MYFEAKSIIKDDDKSCLVWEIENFYDFKGKSLQLQQIESPMFLSSGKCSCDWQFYLLRKIKNNIENLQLNLKFLSSSKVAEIEILQISFDIENNGNLSRKINNIKLKSDEDVLVFLKPTKEIPNYISLSIWCTIQYSAEVISSISQRSIDVEEISTTILSDFKSLLKYKAFSDVKLISQGKEFQVHKMILSARSPVFSAMFQHDMKEQLTNEVIIDDVAPEVLEEMINFIYSDEIANISSGLLMLADKYDIKGLKVKCEHALAGTLKIDNVIEMLNLSRHYNAEYLKYHALIFIKKFANDVVKTSAFKNLEDSQAKILFELFLCNQKLIMLY